jgi:rhodanese-related sulfurtransferase
MKFLVGELKKALSESAEDFKRAYGGAEQPTKDAELIFSCRSGNRSRNAMAAARELGFFK